MMHQVGFMRMSLSWMFIILVAVSSMSYSQSFEGNSAIQQKIVINESLIHAPTTNEKRSILDPADRFPLPTLSPKKGAGFAAGATVDIFSSHVSKATQLDATEEMIEEITSDITTNVIWQANKVYHVTANVNVQALLVIEPGTIVRFSSTGTLLVNNGGTIIASGTPENYVHFVADTGSGYGQYYSAIYMEETASVSNKISYCLFESAYVAVATNNLRLDTPIQHNIFYGCVYGIGETGTQLTDIFNNQIFGSYYDAINVDLKSIGGAEDAFTNILIQNNTCHYYQETGITVHGVTTETNAGTVLLINNIVTGSYSYGLNLIDGYMSAAVVCTGYYGNAQDKNWAFDETASVIATASPFEISSDPLKQVYLVQTGPFVGAGSEGVASTPKILGFTTALNGDCDLGVVDLGFHYPNFNKVNVGEYAAYLMADMNQDGTVNEADLTILRNHYGQQGQPAEGDINGDGIIDAYDLQILRKFWGKNGPVHPNITASVGGDPNNLAGCVEIAVAGYDTDTLQILIFLDGQYIGKIENFANEDYNKIFLETFNYTNGLHKLKVIGVSSYGLTLSQNMDVTFNNSLQCMIAKANFREGKDYHIEGIYIGTENFTIKLIDINDNILWSESIGSSISISIPASEVATDLIFNVIISKVSSLARASSDEDDAFNKFISKEFDPKEWEKNPVNYRFLVTLPEKGLTKEYKKCVMAVRNACNAQGLLPRTLVLYDDNCTWENLSFVLKNITSIRYWYHGGGHGTSQSGRVGKSDYRARTGIQIYDSRWFQNDQWVYSFTMQTDPEELRKRKTIGSLGLAEWSGLKIVFFDVCYTSEDSCAEPFGGMHDMAKVLGMFSTYNSQWHTQTYLGWEGARSTGEIFKFNEFVETFWNTLASGTNTVQEALNAARISTGEFYLEKIQPRGYGVLNQIKFEADPAN